MQYNFSNLLHNSNEEILDEFIDKYTLCIISSDDDGTLVILNIYKKILSTLNSNFKEEELLRIFEELATYKISYNVPYISL